MDNRTSNISDDEQYAQNSNQTPNTSASNGAGQQSGYPSSYNPYLTNRQSTYQTGLYQPPYQQSDQQSNQQTYQQPNQQAYPQPNQRTYQQVPYQAPQAAYRPAGTYYGQAAYAPNQTGQMRRAISYDAHTQKESGHRSVGTVPKVIIGALIGLIVGFLISFILMNVFVTAPIPVSATLAEDKLDTVVGSYRYDGITYQITAREAILGSTTLESRLNDDGTYDTPTADMIVAYARNEILAKLVDENGITVTTEEVTSYALQATGSSNWTVIAQDLGMDEDQAREVMAEAAAVGKLREMVTGGTSTSTAPTAPAYPADGQTEVGTAEYADYIISLLGPYWDPSTGTWANTDNEYYEVLKDQVFAPGNASYEAAELAYTIAYQDYLDSSSDEITWLDYVNSYLDNASIAVATLRA